LPKVIFGDTDSLFDAYEHRLVINKKKVCRLCKELRLLKPHRRVKRKHPRRIAKKRDITAPNQLWEIDIKYGYIAGEEFRNLCVTITR
jgi:putative transposase